MIRTNYGGSVEYIAAVLLALQIVTALPYLKRRHAVWPRVKWAGVVTLLLLLWSATIATLCLTLSGVMYISRAIPASLGAAVAAVGYFWIFLSSLAMGMAWLAARIPIGHSPNRRRWLRAAGIVAIGAPAAAAGYGVFVERHNYRVNELDLPVPGLHPDLDGFRIVQVSDLHVSPFLSARQAGHVIDMANEQKADLAVFTGDLISELGDPLDDAIRELIRLRSDAGVYACMGNHEAYIRCSDYVEHQTGLAGQVFLRNAAAQIHRGLGTLNLAGVDYQRSANRTKYLIGTESLIVPGASNLLLSHNPDVFPAAIQRGFQAVLSGHTHGGQVNVEILHQNVNPARFRTPFTSGLYRLGAAGASCFVTNGVGTIGMPIRLGAPPEIALLRLRRA